MPKTLHTKEEISTFVTELEKQTHRGAALIAAAVLEEILEVLLTARLLKVSRDRHDALFGRGRPLDSMSAKIELGYALGLFTNAARIQLDMIREVRNKFAHRIEALTFDHPNIAKEITSRPLANMPEGQTVRQQFLGVFGVLAAILYGTAAADIRIRPLEETHAEHFHRMAWAVLEKAEAMKSKVEPGPGADPTPGRPKP